MITTFAVGRVGQDAELRYTKDGMAVASFSMAIDQGKSSNGEKRKPLWIKATLWGKKAEGLVEYIKKGIMVAVNGRPQVEAWVGRESGDAQAKIVINVNEFTFCGGGSGEKREDRDDDFDQRTERTAASPGPVTDDDIPF